MELHNIDGPSRLLLRIMEKRLGTYYYSGYYYIMSNFAFAFAYKAKSIL